MASKREEFERCVFELMERVSAAYGGYGIYEVTIRRPYEPDGEWEGAAVGQWQVTVRTEPIMLFESAKAGANEHDE